MSSTIQEAIDDTEKALQAAVASPAAVAGVAAAAAYPPPQAATPFAPQEAPAPATNLKRMAEQAIEASAPEHIAAHREQVIRNRKRLCRYPGCTKVIKSQGHCQRHGARAKRCKIDGCDKQAQGTHDGMCKRHWKATNFPEEATKKGSTPPEPEGESVYDSILPMSIAYRPVQQKPSPSDDNAHHHHHHHHHAGSHNKHDLLDPPAAPDGFQVMPLVAHLKEGTLAGKPAGWHRNAERRARGMFPVKGLSVQLEPWERQLALIEILLLSGGTPYANFKELAFAWGREKGFHHVLANSVCERRGEVERKKRSDAGKSMTDEEKMAFRSKLQKARDKNGTSKKARKNGPQEVAVVAAAAATKMPAPATAGQPAAVAGQPAAVPQPAAAAAEQQPAPAPGLPVAAAAKAPLDPPALPVATLQVQVQVPQEVAVAPKVVDQVMEPQQVVQVQVPVAVQETTAEMAGPVVAPVHQPAAAPPPPQETTMQTEQQVQVPPEATMPEEEHDMNYTMI